MRDKKYTASFVSTFLAFLTFLTVFTIFTFLTISLVSCTGKVLVKAPKKDIEPLPVLDPVTKGEDRLEKQQWVLDTLGVKDVWKHMGSSSKAVVMMIIGTGIDYNHEDLQGNIALNQTELSKLNPDTGLPYNGQDDDGDGLTDNFVGWDFVDEDGLAYDHYGYDTYLAGVVGALHDNDKGIKGILPNVSIYPVRYINTNGQSNVPTLVKALNHIKQVKPHVVLLNLLNLRFTSDESVRKVELEALKKVLKELVEYPIIIGAGNSGTLFGKPNEVRSIFAKYTNVFIVTSINKKGKKPFFANFNMQYVHTSAPGKDILTTAAGNEYKMIDSTHVAAAYVASAIAVATSLFGGQKHFSDFYKALLSSDGSRDISSMEAYTIGRNTLDLSRFVAALQK